MTRQQTCACKQTCRSGDHSFHHSSHPSCPPAAQITSKQLRDDLMTMLIAGHETTAAVLTWTLHCLAGRPDVLQRVQQEVSDCRLASAPCQALLSRLNAGGAVSARACMLAG